MKKLLDLYRQYRQKKEEKRKELDYLVGKGNPFNLPDEVLKKCYKLGFTAQEWVLYDLEHNNPDDYCRVYESFKYRRSIGRYSAILDNKVLFYELIKSWANCNKIYSYKQDGVYHALQPNATIDQIPSLLKESKLAFKKNSSQKNFTHGDGFIVLEYKDDKYFINSENSSAEEIKDLLNKEDYYLIEDYFQQSKFESTIFPYSVNTIRIVTAQDKKTKKYSVLHALQRMGSNPKKAIDNAGAGGLFSEINLETGALYAATSYAPSIGFDLENRKIFYKTHPTTGVQIEGVTIPNWHELKQMACSYHERLAFTGIPLIAWDFALSEKGATVIEANASCLFRLYQSRKGVRNEPLGLWYKEHGFIK